MGRSPALNLNLRMDKDFFFNADKNGQNLAKLPVFTQPIDSLAPGARLQFVLGAGHTVRFRNCQVGGEAVALLCMNMACLFFAAANPQYSGQIWPALYLAKSFGGK